MESFVPGACADALDPSRECPIPFPAEIYVRFEDWLEAWTMENVWGYS